MTLVLKRKRSVLSAVIPLPQHPSTPPPPPFPPSGIAATGHPLHCLAAAMCSAAALRCGLPKPSGYLHMHVVIRRLSGLSQEQEWPSLGRGQVRDGGGKDRCFVGDGRGTRVRERRRTLTHMSILFSSKGVVSQRKQIITDRLFVCGIRRKMLLKSPRGCRRRQRGPRAPPNSP